MALFPFAVDKRKRDVVGPGQSDAQRKEKKVAKLEEVSFQVWVGVWHSSGSG